MGSRRGGALRHALWGALIGGQVLALVLTQAPVEPRRGRLEHLPTALLVGKDRHIAPPSVPDLEAGLDRLQALQGRERLDPALLTDLEVLRRELAGAKVPPAAEVRALVERLSPWQRRVLTAREPLGP